MTFYNAQHEAAPLLSIVELAIVILPFFATQALEIVDNFDDEGWEGYLKVGTTFALFLSVFITAIVVGLVLDIAGQLGGGVRLTAVYFLFAALYLPTLLLLIKPVADATDLLFDSELSQWVIAGVLLVVGIVAAVLIHAAPG